MLADRTRVAQGLHSRGQDPRILLNRLRPEVRFRWKAPTSLDSREDGLANGNDVHLILDPLIARGKIEILAVQC